MNKNTSEKDMREKKILGMLGLATAGGRIALGDSAVREALFRGKAQLIIFARDCGENTREKISRQCIEKGVSHIEFSDKETIGKAVGREGKAVVALTDSGFAKAVEKLACETAD